MKTNLENIDAWNLLEWYESLIKCLHYCPHECHCHDDIPDDIFINDVRNEIERRLES